MTAWIFIALGVAGSVVLIATAARVQGRRLERRMVAELGRRWDQRMQVISVGSREAPADAPAAGAEAPREHPDLQITLEDLLGQRDALLEEFQTVQAQISMLKNRADRRRAVAAVADEDENIVQLNDVLPEEWAERRRR